MTSALNSAQSEGEVRFISYQPAFANILGSKPESKLLCHSTDTGLAHFHEACVYHQPTRSIFVTSNQLDNEKDVRYEPTGHKHVKLFRIRDDEQETSSSIDSPAEEVDFPGIKGAMLNGGVNFGPDSILLCAQGSQDEGDISGVISLDISKAGESLPAPQTVVSNFYGHPFNSVNDVIVHPKDGAIWFTDPCYGHHQGIRRKPALPNQVYRFDPSSKSIRAVADGFTRPNGLCFSPDLKTLYVTDTGAIHGSSDVPVDPAGPSHIYAFDVETRHSEAAPFLTNRRLFAYAPGRFPDGIKCDTLGNVYSGCGDGVEVWNPQGDLIGVIAIEGGAANFCFGEKGVLYACNETKFWKVSLDSNVVKGALLGI